MSYALTPSQTIGPFYWGTLVNAYRADMAPPGVAGERIELVLSLFDVEGALIPDGLFEIWQANSHGRYNFIPTIAATCRSIRDLEGFGRASTDSKGEARFSTVRPGRVPWPAGGLQAPHINISVFARGMLNRLATRLYFDGDAALAEDPVLKLVDLGAAADAHRQARWRRRLAPAGPSRRRAGDGVLRPLTKT